MWELVPLIPFLATFKQQRHLEVVTPRLDLPEVH
jgi:hypothetical protein